MVERQCYFGNDAIANLNRNPSNARLQWWWPAWMAAALQATTASHSLRQVIQPLQPFVDKECRSGMMDQGASIGHVWFWEKEEGATWKKSHRLSFLVRLLRLLQASHLIEGQGGSGADAIRHGAWQGILPRDKCEGRLKRAVQ
uniref:Uncharacterized protein LOC105049634 isoform X5 n=1 Tax=Elaeis guineensis var. tenera TaxID=51953 RepID=A0A6J0PLZ4_ELAGV|nr:uncharacterized protein LOC105049634 isoform X5 [Elaeis guineensis]XP_019707916.1 uncharacterized protein LOC105049634 isoform X5 [Elaeis guineensis]